MARRSGRARPDARARRMKGRWLPLYTGVVIAYLFIPIVVMILFGFNDKVGRFNFAFQGVTLEWYRKLFDIPDLTVALKNTVILGIVSTVIATILGTLIALALNRYRFKGRGGLSLFIFLPMATPEIVLGVALLSMFVTINFARGFTTLIIAHVMFSISYVVVTVRARLVGFDENLEDAAKDLGASSWTTFWTVTFPLIFPGILAAALLALALSIDDFVITSFNNGSVSTFPLWVYGASRIGVPPQVNVMGTLIFAFGALYVIGVMIGTRRKEKESLSP